MRPFSYTRAESAAHALELLRAGDGDTALLAGGTDLVPLMQGDLRTPSRVVDIKRAGDVPRTIEVAADGGVRIGALVPLAEIECHADVRTRFAPLAEAVRDAASVPLRNVATLGGNLLQRPRCWYFRAGAGCWLGGGERCFARDGDGREHAILGDGPCHAVHPSDPATALLALDAAVDVLGATGERTLGIEQLFAAPDASRRQETVLDGELVLGVVLPAPVRGRRGAWAKAMARKTWSFALASAAVTVDVDDDTVASARVALGGVAPVPWRARAAEDVLRGGAARAAPVDDACDAALADARALDDNRYKVDLTRALLRRCLRRALPHGGAAP